MKSVTMSYIFRNPESDSAKALSRDLRTLVSIEDSQRKTILDALSLCRLARNTGEEKKISDELSDKTQLNVVRVEGAIELLKYLLNRILDSDIPNDDPEKWADDLAEESFLNTSEEKKIFEKIIESVQVIAVNEVEPESKRRRVAQATGKNIRSISVHTGILPVNEKEYIDFLASDDYEPKVVDIVASATVRLSIGSNPIEKVIFQAEEADIDMMIESLRAAKKDIAALRKFIRV